MAEIKDVYSLEFNSSQFQSEIDSAIARIEELNSAMADGADVADELAAAQGSLVDILGTEAKGVEQLNQKRNVLVNTQKNLNKETQSGISVGKQLDTTNKQIAVSTGQAAAQQRGLGQTLISGTRQIGQMRRVASTLGFAFRAIGAVLPFGLILSFAGPIIGFFQNLMGATDKSAENMEKLKDSTLPITERLDIANTELQRLNQIEAERGYLTEEENKKRRELVDIYKQTSEQIIKEEEDRYFKLRGMQIDAERIRIKLQGESVEQIQKAAKLEAVAIDLANKKQRSEAYKRYNDALKERDRLAAENLQQQADEFDKIATQAKQELDAIGDLQNAQLDQLDADTAKAIAEFTKRAADEQRKARVDAAKKEIEDTENQFELMLLKTEENSKERIDLETTKDYVLEQLRKKFANELELDETELAIITEKNIQKRLELYKQYNDKLEQQRIENRKKFLEDIEKQNKEYEKKQNELLQYEINRNEVSLNNQLIQLEKDRNAKLMAAYGNAEEQQKIDKEYNEIRKGLEDEANREIIKMRIKFLREMQSSVTLNPALYADLEKQITDLELKYQELTKTVLTENEKTDKNQEEEEKKRKKRLEELKEFSINMVQLASDTVFQVLTANVNAYIDSLDKAIDKSKSALDEIRSNSENYNAQQLEIEKERLEKLENERAKAVEREKTLGQIQVAINAAIAISKAASETGGFGAAFAIAATLASLIAGFAQARVAAGNAFFEGSEYVNRGNNPRGRDTIPAMLNEGERVITTDTNNKYWDVLSAVHKNRIPADVLNSFANAYQAGGLKAALGAFGENVSLSSELGNKSIFVNVAQTYQGMENRLERIEAVLTDLPKYMPRTVVSANANGIFKIVEQRQRRKNFSSNWSK